MKRSGRLVAAAAASKASASSSGSTIRQGNKKRVQLADEDDGERSPYFPVAEEEVNNNNNSNTKKKARLEAPSLLETSSTAFLSKKTTTTGRLGKSFYDQDCLSLCQALLGTVLVRRLETGEVLKGTIVETEAYPGDQDRASQSFQGKRTPRNEAMFMAPGTAYVYFTYGMYFCFNISSRGEGAACLIRAVEPLEDYETMHQFRQPKPKKNAANKTAVEGEDKSKSRKRLKTYELANGPSKLCIAFGINRDKCDKLDMVTSEELWLEASKDMKYLKRNFEIATDKRIGIDSTPPEARNKLWRFYVKDSFAESRAKIKDIKTRLGI